MENDKNLKSLEAPMQSPTGKESDKFDENIEMDIDEKSGLNKMPETAPMPSVPQTSVKGGGMILKKPVEEKKFSDYIRLEKMRNF